MRTPRVLIGSGDALFLGTAIAIAACSGGSSIQSGSGESADSDGGSDSPSGSDIDPPSSTSDGGRSGTGAPTAAKLSFDDLAAWTVVTDQYANLAVFSTTDSNTCVADPNSHVNNSSEPNYLCCGRAWPGLYNSDIYVQFAAPVQNLKFVAVAVNGTQGVGQIKIYQNGTMTTTYDVVGAGNSRVTVPIDLSAYPNITRIEKVNDQDYDGFGIDDLSFEIQ